MSPRVTLSHLPHLAQELVRLHAMCPVFSNHLVIAGNVAAVRANNVTFPTTRLPSYDLGAFPGLVPRGSQAVAGEVYEVDEPTLAALDRLERHLDFYRRTTIALHDGRPVLAYLLTIEQVGARPIIASGAWRTRHEGRWPDPK